MLPVTNRSSLPRDSSLAGDWTPPRDSASPWFRVGADAVRLLRDGRQVFPAMLEAIAGATKEVLLEMYWIGADAVGERFREALAGRARAGVAVRVIYDAIGSRGVTPSFWHSLAAAGGRTAEFHSVSPFDRHFRLDRVELRDHRKLLVVDGEMGFTGGVNLASPWLAREEGGENWRDDAVQVHGVAAEELRTLFFRTWRQLAHEKIPADLKPLSRRHTRPVWVLASQWRTRRSIHREYLSRIRRARTRIDVANSYFVPDRNVRRALSLAVRRGVEVRVLVPERSDVRIVQYATESLFETLLGRGVRIWTLPAPMLHAKTAIIDDTFTTIGSYNLDYRSWRKNLEVNLAVEDQSFAEHVRASFERDLARSHPVDGGSWQQRPWTRRGMEWLAFAMRRVW
jgi:cardiolipin synthase